MNGWNFSCMTAFHVYHRHMRTTIDMPDDLFRRLKPLLAERKMTFRALVIDAVERAIDAPSAAFRLRDASAGHPAMLRRFPARQSTARSTPRGNLLSQGDDRCGYQPSGACHQCEASLHGKAKEVIRNLAESPTPWSVCLHSFVEFYGVATHPKLWKKPSTPEQAIDQSRHSGNLPACESYAIPPEF